MAWCLPACCLGGAKLRKRRFTLAWFFCRRLRGGSRAGCRLCGGSHLGSGMVCAGWCYAPEKSLLWELLRVIPVNWYSSWRTFWHSNGHSNWHSIWHIFWHSIWLSFWHTHLYVYIYIWSDIPSGNVFGVWSGRYTLTLYLAFYWTYILTFYLASFVAFYLTSGTRGCGPAVPTALRPGARGGGPAVPTDIWSLRLAVRTESATDIWSLRLSRQCPLRSGARSWDPRLPEEKEKEEKEESNSDKIYRPSPGRWGKIPQNIPTICRELIWNSSTISGHEWNRGNTNRSAPSQHVSKGQCHSVPRDLGWCLRLCWPFASRSWAPKNYRRLGATLALLQAVAVIVIVRSGKTMMRWFSRDTCHKQANQLRVEAIVRSTDWFVLALSLSHVNITRI